MHMHSKWLALFLYETISKYNHPYLPGKGTKTAAKEYVKKILPSKFVYEFDLKQFFPSVPIETVTKLLREEGVIEEEAKWLEEVNKTQPRLAEETKLDESRVIKRQRIQKDLAQGWASPDSPIYDEVRALGPLALDIAKS